MIYLVSDHKYIISLLFVSLADVQMYNLSLGYAVSYIMLCRLLASVDLLL